MEIGKCTQQQLEGDTELVENPEPVYDALGPDALRMWAASSDYTRDVVIGRQVLQCTQQQLEGDTELVETGVDGLEHLSSNHHVARVVEQVHWQCDPPTDYHGWNSAASSQTP
jgi:hypothetical protein